MYRNRLLLLLATLLAAASSLCAQTPPTLSQLILAANDAKALAAADGAGRGKLILVDVPGLDEGEGAKLLAGHFGRPISSELLSEVINILTEWAQKRGMVLAKVTIPVPQDIGRGVVRLSITAAQFNQVTLRGNRWFSRTLIEQRLGIKPGDELRLSTLEEAVTWANTNPFRHLQVLLNPVPNDPSKVDLVVAVHERAPYRLTAAYSNGGNAVLGRNQYTAAVQFGNLWGLDHQASYQYTLTDLHGTYNAHAFDYRVPLRWRHFIQLNGSFGQLSPSFEGGLFNQRGQSANATLRYTVPLRRKGLEGESFIGFDFKQSNSNLEYGGTQTFASKADVFQLALGGTLVRRDSRGAWGLSANLFASPGDLSSHNNQRTYSATRFGSKARYLYGSLSLQRLLSLTNGWEIVSRVNYQFSSANLLGSEQLSIGGATTVRGYPTNVSTGDTGFIFNNDLQTRPFKHKLSGLSKRLPPLEVRYLLFFDTARVQYRFPLPARNLEPVLAVLASVGPGVRMNISNYFSLTFDYGQQLTHLAPVRTGQRIPQLHSAGHVKVVLAF